MGYKCSAFGCLMVCDKRMTPKDVTFHRYPLSNPKLCRAWVKANPRKNFQPTKYSALCSLHFRPSDFTSGQNYNDRMKRGKGKKSERILKPNVVPSVFLTSSTDKSKVTGGSLSAACVNSTQKTQKTKATNDVIHEAGGSMGALQGFSLDEILNKLNMETLPDGFMCSRMREKILLYRLDISPGLITVQCGIILTSDFQVVCSSYNQVLHVNIYQDLLSQGKHITSISQLLQLISRLTSCGEDSADCYVKAEPPTCSYSTQLYYGPATGAKFSEVKLSSDESSTTSLVGHVVKLSTQTQNLFERLESPPRTKLEVADDVNSDSNDCRVEAPHPLNVYESSDRFYKSASALERLVQDLQTSPGSAADGRYVRQESSSKDVATMRNCSVVLRRVDDHRPTGPASNKLSTDPRPTGPASNKLSTDRRHSAPTLPTGNKPPENRSPENRSPENRSPENRSPENRSPENRSPENRSPENRSPENKPSENKPPANKSKARDVNSRKSEITYTSQGKSTVGEVLPASTSNQNKSPFPVSLLKCENTAKDESSGVFCESFSDGNAAAAARDIEEYEIQFPSFDDSDNSSPDFGESFEVSQGFSVTDSLRAEPPVGHQERTGGQDIMNKSATKLSDRFYQCNPSSLDTTGLSATLDQQGMCRKADDKQYRCAQCDKSYSVESDHQNHMKLTHSEVKYKCDRCDYSSSYSRAVENHISAVHLNSKLHKCSQCESSFLSPRDLTLHIQSVHNNDGNYKCSSCDYRFMASASLDHHFKIYHLGKQSRACELCDFECSQKKELTLHHKTVHGGKRFVCTDCTFRSANKTHLMMHYRAVHSKQKFYSCTECNKSFSFQNGLAIHVKTVHRDLRPYVCHDCGRSFKQIQALRAHMKGVHLKLKPYSCSVCEMSFVFKNGLQRHRRTHGRVQQDESSSVVSVPDATSVPHCKSSVDDNIQKSTISSFSNIKESSCADFELATDLSVNNSPAQVELQESVRSSPSLEELNISLSDFRGLDVSQRDPVDTGCTNTETITDNKGIGDQDVIESCTGQQSDELDDCKNGSLSLNTCSSSTTLDQHVQLVRLSDKPYQCNQCQKSYDSAVKLRKHIRLMHSDLKYNCDRCDYSSRYVTLVKYHISAVHLQLKPYKCSQCDASFSWPKSLTAHIRSAHNNEKKFKCSTCEKKFTQHSSLQKHWKKFHSGEKPYSCNQCDFVSSRQRELTLHRKTVHEGKRYSCTDCKFRSVTKTDFVRHCKAVHAKLKSFSCTECDKAFGCKANLTSHIASVHKGHRPYLCSVCGNSFTRRQGLQIHMKGVHLNLKPFSCSVCGKHFLNKPKLEKHILSHIRKLHLDKSSCLTLCNPEISAERSTAVDDNIKNCVNIAPSLHDSVSSLPDVESLEVSQKDSTSPKTTNTETITDNEGLISRGVIENCDVQQSGNFDESSKSSLALNTFNSSTSISQPVQSISTKKRHLCRQCNNFYSSTSNLQKHVAAMHSEVKYNCDKCEYSSKYRSSVKNHISAIHLKSKPYKCSQCDVSFPYSTSLTVHIRSAHNKERKFKCSTCEKKFTQRSCLKRHWNIFHSGEKPYSCDQCDYVCSHKRELRHHYRTDHYVEKRIHCSQCDYKTSANAFLKMHCLAVHSTEKAFPCADCDKAFAFKRSLKVHVNSVHKGQKPYLCPDCGCSFSQSQTLHRHMKGVHRKAKTHSCLVCDKSFLVKRNLDNHMLTHDSQYIYTGEAV